MSKNSKDLIISLVCIGFALCFLLIIIPLQIPLPRFSSGGTTPQDLPKISAILVIAMSAIILVRTILRDRRCFPLLLTELKAAARDRNGWKTFGYVLMVFAVSVLYYVGYATLGFFITTLVCFPLYAYVLGARKPVAIIVTDLVLTFGIYYSFAIFMNSHLPGWKPF